MIFWNALFILRYRDAGTSTLINPVPFAYMTSRPECSITPKRTTGKPKAVLHVTNMIILQGIKNWSQGRPWNEAISDSIFYFTPKYIKTIKHQL